MTNKSNDWTGARPSILKDIDDLDVGPAPIREVLDAGRTVTRRRRAVLAAVAAVTVLLLGGGLFTAQTSGAPETSESADSRIADSNRDLGRQVGGRTFDPLDMTLTLLEPLADGSIPSRFSIENNTDKVVVDPGCLLYSTASGVVPPQAPEGPLLNPGPSAAAYCVGSAEIQPGYSRTSAGPTFRTIGLTPGAYLAVVDYGNLRTDRITAPFDFPGAATPAPEDLRVTVTPMNAAASYVAPLFEGSALWFAEEKKLIFLTRGGYDSCLLEGRATTAGGVTDVTLDRPSNNKESCDDYSRQAVVTVWGPAVKPTELTLTEDGARYAVDIVAIYQKR